MTISEIEQLVMGAMDRYHDDVYRVEALAPVPFLNQGPERAEEVRPAPLQHSRPRRRHRAFSRAARWARSNTGTPRSGTSA